jgi:hypothetical protein
VPQSVHREIYYSDLDLKEYVPSIGEHVILDFDCENIDSSPLTIKVDTPDGQEAKTTFDLTTLR